MEIEIYHFKISIPFETQDTDFIRRAKQLTV